MDYEELTAVPVVFSPGVTTQTVTLTTLTDAVAEGDETLTATITTTQSGVGIIVSLANITIKEETGMCFSCGIYSVVTFFSNRGLIHVGI